MGSVENVWVVQSELEKVGGVWGVWEVQSELGKVGTSNSFT